MKPGNRSNRRTAGENASNAGCQMRVIWISRGNNRDDVCGLQPVTKTGMGEWNTVPSREPWIVK